MNFKLFKKPAGPGFLDPAFRNEIALSRINTPDMRNLEMQEDHFLAVADEMQEDHWNYGNFHFMEKLKYDVFTQHPVMMLKEDLGPQSHPLIFNSTLRYQNPPPFVPVKCELYRVTPQHILMLDKYKLNTVVFERKKILLVIPYSELFFKDRSIAKSLLGRESNPNRLLEINGHKTGLLKDTTVGIDKALLRKRGVYRVWGWMYFSKPSFWENLISITNRNPPVRTFTNPDGVVKEYYKYTNAEYDIERHNL